MTGSLRLEYADVPPSYNRVGGRGHWRGEWSQRKRWRGIFEVSLMRFGDLRDVEHVTARASLRFPVVRRRDVDNFVPVLNKALADALVSRGVIPDDTAEFYAWAGLRIDREPGPARTVVELDLDLGAVQ